jgi:hypothetical protein
MASLYVRRRTGFSRQICRPAWSPNDVIDLGELKEALRWWLRCSRPLRTVRGVCPAKAVSYPVYAPAVTSVPELPGTLAAYFKDVALGHRTLPLDSDAKRHHFVPRFVLRGFVDSRKAGERLWQLDKVTGQIDLVTVEAAASRHQFYRVRVQTGGESNYLEALFSVVEDHAAPSLRLLHEAPEKLDPGHRVNVGFFLGLQEARTPAGQRRLGLMISTAERLRLSSEFANGRNFKRRMRRRFPSMPATEIEDRRQQMLVDLRDGRVVLGTPKEMILQGLLRNWLTLAGVICDQRWAVLCTDSPAFVIGDRPLMWFDPTPRFPWSSAAPQSSDTSFGLFPLRADACLRLSQSGDDLVRRRAERQSQRINLRSWGWAERHVFAADPLLLEELHAAAADHPDLTCGPPPDSTVVLEAADPDDASVGSEHPPGWPRGLWQRGEGNEPDQFCRYTVVRCDEDITPTIDERYLRAA